MLANCSRCGDVFAKDRLDTCPKCRANENEQIDRLKDFVYDNPNASLQEISTVSGISEKELLQYVRENRFVSLDVPALSITCEECGTPVTQGRFCRACTQKLSSGLSKSAADILSRKTQ